MLAELSIKNFAIIESLSISFEKGLTVLTGETGAGKSIIIDAIGLLAGGRGSAEFIRYGENRAEIEGLFIVEATHPVVSKLKELGIEITDEMVVLRRDISSSGKSVCRINGKLVTLGILREIGQTLIDIHGQHENQALMDSSTHLQLLDRFDESSIKPALDEYQPIFRQYQLLNRQLQKLSDSEKEIAHRLDLIQYQLQEIQKADLKPGEDEELLDEKMKLANYEKIYTSIQDSYQALSGEKRGLDWIGLAMSHLEAVAGLDNELNKVLENVSAGYYALEEGVYSLRDKLDSMEFDPARLDYIEERLNEINFLKKKYGETVMDVLEYAAAIEDELDTIQNRDTHLRKLEMELKDVTNDLILEAQNIRNLRKKIADQLTDAIHKELKELYMEKTVFQARFTWHSGKMSDPVIDGQHVSPTEGGMDEVEFLISTNPGEPLKSLSKVASGGELSRMMLALKSIFAKHQGVTSIIFDEVDTGVSGRVAQAIAEKIHHIAADSQVLCITHLPQVAAMADTHLYISKETLDGRTKTSVVPLCKDEQVKEIARMISGVEMTELTLQHANELLEIAQKMKSNI